MNCPYCAEEIKDEAVVCRYCGHDFSLVKPLLVRLISLEKKVKESSTATPPSPASAAAPSYPFAAIVAVTLSIIFTSGYFLVMNKPETTASQSSLPYIFTIAIPPAVFGLLFGLAGNRRSPLAYFLSGFSLGFLNLAFIGLMLYSFFGSGGAAKIRWDLTLVTFALGQPLTFATAAFLGNSLRSRWSPSAEDAKTVGAPGGAKGLSANLTLLADVLKSGVALATTIGAAYQLLKGVFS